MNQYTEKLTQPIPPAYSKQGVDFSSNDNNSNLSSSVTLDSIEKPEQTHATNVIHKWRFILRVFQMLNVIGSFGFQASASTWSGKNVPFKSLSLFYYFYAVEWLSFIWSAFCIYVSLSMKMNKTATGNIKPAIVFAVDTLLASLLGVGISTEIGSYNCPAGGFNGWCNFYNAGLCFGMMLFLSFGISALWDLFNGLSCLRTKSSSNNNLV